MCVGVCVCAAWVYLYRGGGQQAIIATIVYSGNCYVCYEQQRGGGIGRRDSWIDHFSSNIQYCGNLYFFRGISGYLIFSDTSGLENPFRSPTSLSYSSEISGVFTFRQYFGVFIFKNFDIFRDSNF